MTTSDDNYNDNNNNERSEALSTSVHSARVGGIQSRDPSVFPDLSQNRSFHNFS